MGGCTSAEGPPSKNRSNLMKAALEADTRRVEAEKAARERKAAEEKAAEEEERRIDALPPIAVTVRLKDAEDMTITVKPGQHVFESVIKGLDPNQLWTDLDEVRYGETKLASSTTWETEGKSSLCMCRQCM